MRRRGGRQPAGLSEVKLVGLARSAVRESIERVRRAIINAGFGFPLYAVLVNLPPAGVKKDGPGLDLSIAIGPLRATDFVKDGRHRDDLVAGELAPDGRVRRIKGALSLALLAEQLEMRGVVLSEENRREAAVVDGVDVHPVATLGPAAVSLNGQVAVDPYPSDGDPYASSAVASPLDVAALEGQETVERAITTAAGVAQFAHAVDGSSRDGNPTAPDRKPSAGRRLWTSATTIGRRGS